MNHSSGFSSPGLARMSAAMRSYVDRGEVAGLVILLCRGDEVHVEAIGVQDLKTVVPVQRDTIFRVASLSKPIAAVAGLILVEEEKISLDDPVDRWLPELASQRVLRSVESELDDTVPANRAITLRDLLTFTLGFGFVLAPPGTYPIQKAIAEAGLAPGPRPPAPYPDEWISKFASLPLVYQPGERWMYHTGSEVLSVLIARVAGVGLGDFLHERIFSPLGMKDTAFSVPEEKIDRLATSYLPDANGLKLYDEARNGMWSVPPAFSSGGGGLVSTADDYLAFARMLLNGGIHGATRILGAQNAKKKLTDQVTAEQKSVSPFFPSFWETRGWGHGISVVTAPEALADRTGTFGWDGGLGTSCYSDPKRDLTGILMTQTAWAAPLPPNVNVDFWKAVYQSVDA